MQTTLEILKDFILLYAHSFAVVAMLMPIFLMLAEIFNPVIKEPDGDKTEPQPMNIGYRFKRLYDLLSETKNKLMFYRVFVIALFITVIRCLG